VASKLAKIADIDIEEFAMQMFRAGSALDGMSPREILNNDFKDYVINKSRVGIGQIISVDPQNFQELKTSLLEYMNYHLVSNGYRLLLLMVTDVVNEGSYLLFAGDNGALISKAFGVEQSDNSVFLQGVVSRKKQVVPLLANAISF
jgi:manganese-dependent inorganic pyrophosphatase